MSDLEYGGTRITAHAVERAIERIGDDVCDRDLKRLARDLRRGRTTLTERDQTGRELHLAVIRKKLRAVVWDRAANVVVTILPGQWSPPAYHSPTGQRAARLQRR